jgi:hypothetical protein
MLAGQLALIAASFFSGAAVYINVAEQPARLALGDRAMLEHWKLAYKRGFAMQAPLALIGFLFGLIAAYALKDWRWLIGAFLLLCNWPLTLLAIMPTNHMLTALKAEDAGSQSRALLLKWGHLHAARSALGVASTFAFLWASLR